MGAKSSALDVRQNPLRVYSLSGLLAAVFVLALFAIFSSVVPAWLEAYDFNKSELLSRHQQWIRPEPLERALYILLAICSAGVCVFSNFLARFLLGCSEGTSLGALLSWGPTGLCLVTPLLILLSLPQFSIAQIVLQVSSLHPRFLWGTCALAFAAAFCLLKLAHKERPSRGVHVWVVGISFILFIIISSVWRIFGPGSVTMSWVFVEHLNAVLFPQSQAFGGKTIFIDFPSQYGGFAELLNPWFKVVGLNVLSFSVTLSALVGLSIACLLVFLRRYVHSVSLFFLGSAALVLSCSVWYSVVAEFEPYFQYTPIRLVCPALALILFDRRPGNLYAPLSPWTAFFLGLFCGFAVIWNLDSGVVVAGTFLATQLFELSRSDLWPNRQPATRLEKTRRLVAFTISIAGLLFFICLFNLKLYWQSGEWVRWADIMHYQKAFYSTGFYMIPMPTTLHPWMLIIGVYIIGLILGIEWARGHLRDSRLRPVLILSIMGIGLFSYYQGRSADSNLVWVSWPATLILFLLCQSALDLCRARRISIFCAFPFVASVMSVGALATVQVSRAIPALLQFTEKHINDIRYPASPISENVSFISTALEGGKECAILADQQAIYQTELQIVSPLRGPGLQGVLLKSEIKSINQQFLSNPPANLVIGRSVLMGPENDEQTIHMSKIIADRFHLVSQSKDGSLSYYKRN